MKKIIAGVALVAALIAIPVGGAMVATDQPTLKPATNVATDQPTLKPYELVADGQISNPLTDQPTI